MKVLIKNHFFIIPRVFLFALRFDWSFFLIEVSRNYLMNRMLIFCAYRDEGNFYQAVFGLDVAQVVLD